MNEKQLKRLASVVEENLQKALSSFSNNLKELHLALGETTKQVQSFKNALPNEPALDASFPLKGQVLNRLDISSLPANDNAAKRFNALLESVSFKRRAYFFSQLNALTEASHIENNLGGPTSSLGQKKTYLENFSPPTPTVTNNYTINIETSDPLVIGNQLENILGEGGA